MDARLEVLFARRSVRDYTAEPVSEADLTALMEGAMASPSANNSRPWQFVTVSDRTKLAALAEASPHAKMLASAALAVAVCGDVTASAWWEQDCSAATQNLLLAASMIGLGAVWLGISNSPEREDKVRQILGIPAEIGVLSLISIGHPTSMPRPRTQYEVGRVHRESW